MLKIIRITGKSMEPLYRDGDYALLWTARTRRVRPRDIVAVRHPTLGLIFKRVERITDSGHIEVRGLHPHSTDSRSFGALPPDLIAGKALIGIRARHG